MGRKIHQFCKLTISCLVIFSFSNVSFTSELDEIINSNKNNVLAVTHSGFLYAIYKFVSNKDLYIKPNDLDVEFNNGCVVFLTLDIDKDETKITFDYKNKKLTKNIKDFH